MNGGIPIQRNIQLEHPCIGKKEALRPRAWIKKEIKINILVIKKNHRSA
jgi:hypothetical protein